MPPRLTVHLVSHTHWDREWYLPAGRFRQRLVALVDELLDDPPSAGSAFLLDGQAIVLEDYLSVRPERAGELATLLREGRIEAGPWYVLGDELIPGAEAMVRNLLMGRRALAALRATAPRVLYCPDSFGHPAALPELARGFGLPLIVLWRGYGGARWPAGDFVWWRAPSGARVLVHHLPRDGYEFGSSLPVEERAARDRWERMRAELAPRASLGPVLLTHGADHHARQERWREATAALVAAAMPDNAHASSLDRFAESAVAAAEGAQLAEITGELRDSHGYTWSLQGTFGSRAHQKRRNAAAERLLVREAEPWALLARLSGGIRRRPLVDAAWRSLLACHPHDTLCGCVTDEVARAMDARLDDAMAQGAGVRDDALLDLIGHDPVRARERPDLWREAVIVRNPSARERSGIAILQLVTKLADVPVGPGSAMASATPLPPPAAPARPAIPMQLLDLTTTHERTESPRHYPDDDLVAIATVAALVPSIPGYGIAALPAIDATGDSASIPAHRAARAGERSIENALLRLESGADGALTLGVAGEAAPAIGPLVAFEDHVDLGDLYTPSIRGRASEARCETIRIVHAGPLRAELEQRWVLRSPERAELTAWVELRFSLDLDASLLRIAVRGENHASDHRLRIVIATGVASPEVWADAAFGPQRRTTLRLNADEAAIESALPTAPLHRYVSLFGEGGGATLYSDGLAEYEVLDDGRIAITLVRAVGELSRPDLPERPGNAGWPAATPEAQCRHHFEAELALFPHGGRRDDATVDLIERIADDALLPLTGRTLRSAIDVHDAGGLALEGEGLAFSAARDSADGEWMVLRCVNLLDRGVAGAWHLDATPREAWLARLDETPLEPLPIDGARLRFAAGPHAVVTLLVH